MRYGSVCSGIEAATMAWHHMGWEPAFFSEIDPFPRSVLSHHYPDVPLHDDFTTIGENQYGSIELLVGGTPCQSFSVAGLRGGMADDRGNLALEFLRLAQRKTPKWLVWENVPGVLSSNGGRDFGSFLGALAEIGYGFAYRVLDAQYFGVAQRRRRVFVVGCLGDWRRAAAVLFERESLLGNPAPSRETGEKVAPAVTTGPPFSRTGNERVECEAIVPVTGPLTAGMGKGPRGTEGIESNHVIPTVRLDLPEHDVCGTLSDGAHMGGGLNGQDAYSGRVMAVGFQSIANACDAAAAGENVSPTLRRDPMAVAYPINDKATRHAGATGKGSGNGLGIGKDGDPCPTLTTGDKHAVAFTQNQRDEVREMEVPGTLATNPGAKQQSYVREGLSVRRLTPTECERLQGFPDNFTQIPYRNKSAEKCPDGPRYKALGNSMAVPVMRWIGERIQQVDKL